MALLAVRFKSNTSPKWASEKLTELGLSERTGGISEDLQFILIANPVGFYALLKIPADKEMEYSRAIQILSPQVVGVEVASIGKVVSV